MISNTTEELELLPEWHRLAQLPVELATAILAWSGDRPENPHLSGSIHGPVPQQTGDRLEFGTIDLYKSCSARVAALSFGRR